MSRLRLPGSIAHGLVEINFQYVTWCDRLLKEI